MELRKIIGVSFIFISALLSLEGILSSNITGAVIGLDINNSVFTILTLVFLLLGLLFISKVGKGLAALVLGGAALVGGHYAKEAFSPKYNIENITGIDGKWDVKRKAEKSSETSVGNYQTIQSTKNIPAVIVESFFGTNENDLKYFMNKKNRKKFCDEVVEGVENYVKANPNIEVITIAGGHGESDPGAVFGPKGNIHESDFNKEMSKYIADKLKKDGYNVKYLWYKGNGGQEDRLDYYTSQANKYSGKSVYVEIHADAAKKGVAGSRVYGPKPKKANPKSHKFGESILKEINESW
ncbi:MAG: N-acetylmuramoyl-L-alanine amidase [Nanobdellota archaeon]